MLRASCWRGVVKVLSCITIEHPSLRGDIQDKAECYSSSATLRLHRANTNESFGVQLYFSGPENIPTVYVTGVLPSLRRNCVLLSQLFPGGKVLQPQAVVLSAINGRVVHSAKSAEAMLRDDRDVTLQLAFTAQRDGDEDATKDQDKAHGDEDNKEGPQHGDEVASSHQQRRRGGSRQRNAASSSSSSPSTLSRNRAAMPAGIAAEGDAEHVTRGVSSGPAKRGRKPKSATTTTTAAALHGGTTEKDGDEDVTWFERRANAVVDRGIAADIATPATAAGNARATSSSTTTHGRDSVHGTSAAGSAATDTPRRRGRPRKSSSSSAAATDTVSPLSQPSRDATTTTAAKSTTTTTTKATTSTPAAGSGPVTASPTSAAASSPAADDSDDLLAV